MASLIPKANGSYEVIVSLGYNEKGKKIRKSKTFHKPEKMSDKKWEKEIIRLSTEFESKLKQINVIDSNITLRDFSERWLKEYAAHNLEQTTIDSYKRELRTKILPALGHHKLGTIAPYHIVQFLNNLLEDGVRVDGKPGSYSDKTISYQWQILSSMFSQAVYWQILPDNPCKSVKAPKNKKSNRGFNSKNIKHFDEAQASILLNIIDENTKQTMESSIELQGLSEKVLNFNDNNHLKYKAISYIALFCGLRNGEILGLTWNDIDFVNKTISVNKSRAYTEEEGMITKYPKNLSSVREISAPKIVMNLLREYKIEQKKSIEIVGDYWDQKWYDMPWLFTQIYGKGMYYQTPSKWLKKVIKRYNKSIENNPDLDVNQKNKLILPELSIHSLRHTSATLLISKNTDIRTVSARLGHSQTSTTMDIYAHSLKSSDRRASDVLDVMFNNKDEPEESQIDN